MIEQPPSSSHQPPFHLLDTLVSDGKDFQKWEDSVTFDNLSQQLFGVQDTNHLENSVGCLLQRVGNSFHFLATAFAVQHLPQPSNLTLDDPRYPNNAPRPIKALLLTAAHVYSSPLSCRETLDDIFFTISPTVSEATLGTYSKFKVERLLSFDPAEEEEQIDPLTNYQCMVPRDFELLAIIEGDPAHQVAVHGNDLCVLRHQPLNQPEVAQSCVIVGYPGRLDEDEIGLWAPIVGRIPGLKNRAREICRLRSQIPTRVFATGNIIGANERCVAVNCSTWAGMSGSPICISSNGTLKYCGIYNGSAALPFQRLVSKILFRLQGKQFLLNENDIPGIEDQNNPPHQVKLAGVPNPPRPRIQNKLLWAKILKKLLNIFLEEDSPEELIWQLDSKIRIFPKMAEETGINVQHNLGVCGGVRFNSLRDHINKTFNLQAPQLFNFIGLSRFDPDHPLVQDQVLGNIQTFLNEGINGKRRRLLIFTLDAHELSFDLVRELRKFIADVSDPANISTITENKVERKFRKLWRQFQKIFEIWRKSLNAIP